MNNPKMKIFIIEDDKSLRHALEEAITRQGLLVILAKDGEEGLSLALKHHPNLILLDIIMPKLNGIKMLKKLREDDWGKTVPVLLLTNDSNPEHMRDALKDNAIDYLIKSDWEIEDVVNKVKSTLKIR